jgi:hypothetical protein
MLHHSQHLRTSLTRRRLLQSTLGGIAGMSVSIIECTRAGDQEVPQQAV